MRENFDFRTPERENAPPNLLADVAIKLKDYPALQIVGGSVWKGKEEGEISVTLPAQKGKDGRYFDLVRGDKDALKQLKTDILAAYRDRNKDEAKPKTDSPKAADARA